MLFLKQRELDARITQSFLRNKNTTTNVASGKQLLEHYRKHMSEPHHWAPSRTSACHYSTEPKAPSSVMHDVVSSLKKRTRNAPKPNEDHHTQHGNSNVECFIQLTTDGRSEQEQVRSVWGISLDLARGGLGLEDAGNLGCLAHTARSDEGGRTCDVRAGHRRA